MVAWGVRAVVHVLSSLGLGGQEMLVQRLAARQARRGWSVAVVSLETAPAEATLAAALGADGIAVHQVPKRAGVDRTMPLTMGRLLHRLRPDVVHTHNPLPLIYAAWPAALVGARVIHTKHGANPARGANLWARRAAARAVDAFVAVSPHTAAQARAARECAGAKLHTIVNGVDTERFAPNAAWRRAHRVAWGVDNDTCVFISVGRLDENKNHQLLVAAFAAVAGMAGAAVKLVVVGDGPTRAALERQAAALGVASSVVFLGRRADTHELLAAADVFALTSQSEGMPLAAAEAMACGLPVVATDVGGMRDLVGSCGVLVPLEVDALAETLTQCYREPSVRRGWGASARLRVEGAFSLTAMEQAYADLYAR